MLQIDIEGNYGTVPASAITNLTRRLRIAVQAANPWAVVSFDLSFNAHLQSYQVRQPRSPRSEESSSR